MATWGECGPEREVVGMLEEQQGNQGSRGWVTVGGDDGR